MAAQLDQRLPGSFAETLQQDPEAWAIRISARWRMGVEAIISTGRLLKEAKAALPHGGFGSCLAQLPFGERQAQMLMAIADHPIASNPQYIALLPPSWGTIYDCTRVPTATFERAVAEGIIRPDMERADVGPLLPRLETSSGEAKGKPQTPAGSKTADDLARDSSDGGDGCAPGEPVADQRSSADAFEASSGDSVVAGLRPGPSETPSMPGGGLAIAHNRVEPAGLDFFPTPLWATRALVEHVFSHLDRKQHCKFQTVWEPACGEGHMAAPLGEYFREVIASDIKDYGFADQYVVDFLSVEHLNRQYDADWIITNPPFGENTDKFILKALSLAGTGVAMLVRLQCLETVGRYEKIFRDTPPTLISFFVERVPMHKGRWLPDGDTMTAYVWLVWIKGAEPQAPFWIPPGCREALTKPEDAARFGFVEAPAAEAAE